MPLRKVLALELFSRLKLMHSRGIVLIMPYISKINFKRKKFKAFRVKKSGQVET